MEAALCVGYFEGANECKQSQTCHHGNMKLRPILSASSTLMRLTELEMGIGTG